ncbi:hypothetical protein [Ewingella americana]|uniref:Uncharacterized protein n=1 Tax=Ewingella americana TaxID=41202 RepID=A0A502GE27_9GAMM|nr:hypothetical protein [Ewingella americana]TPG60001.1 hypothetical protein EAH77_15655 [Ewingella americana]
MATKVFDIQSILAAILPRPNIQILISEYPELGMDAVDIHNFYFNSHLTEFYDIPDEQRILFNQMIMEFYPFLHGSLGYCNDNTHVREVFIECVSNFKGVDFIVPPLCNFHTHEHQLLQQKLTPKKSKVVIAHDAGFR